MQASVKESSNRVIFLDRRGTAPFPDEKVEDSGGASPLPDEKVEESGVTELEPEDLPF